MTATQPLVLLHGNTKRPCGFTLINRRLIAGLRAQGFTVAVASIDDDVGGALPERLPDIYLFHGDPYDFAHAPGTLNVCFLHWEYRQTPKPWVDALNARFDLVIAPSRESKRLYEASGIHLSVIVCPAAVDTGEFHPDVPAWPAPTTKGFRFVHLGGAHRRRGTDILLRAYAAEFSSNDDVTLIMKTFHYEHHHAWLQEVRRSLERPDAPEVCTVHETLASAAPVFTAADVGVYPLRAECLGLPVLECIASGRPVIATERTALNEFCSASNAWFLRATERPNGDHTGVEPDETHLRALLRHAYERGKGDKARQRELAATVSHCTWERSCGMLADGLRQHLLWKQQRRGKNLSPTSVYMGEKARSLAADDRTVPSRGPVPRNVNLRHWFEADFVSSLERAFRDQARSRQAEPRVVVGKAGACLEQFRTAADGCRKLWCAFDALEGGQEIEQRERRLCGAPEVVPPNFLLWKRARERQLADGMLVCGEIGHDSLTRLGVPRARILKMAPSVTAPRVRRTPREEGADRPIRFFFASDQPFRDGVRVLFETWNSLRFPDCQLHCAVNKTVLTAPHVLRLLVANPTIILHEAPENQFAEQLVALIAEMDYLVHPSYLDDVTPYVRYGIALGSPAIVSRGTSVAVDIRDGSNGYIVEELTPDALALCLSRARNGHADFAELERAVRDVAACWSWDRAANSLATWRDSGATESR